MQVFHIIVATDQCRGIGKNGTLPWQIPGDMAFFKKKTTSVSKPYLRNAVIMGRKTWESIPEKFRPLKDRLNIVITRQPSFDVPEGVVTAESLQSALTATIGKEIENVFVIGGAMVYEEASKHPCLDRIYWTFIHHEFDCDTFFPMIGDAFDPVIAEDSEVRSENGIEYQFRVLRKLGTTSGQPA